MITQDGRTGYLTTDRRKPGNSDIYSMRIFEVEVEVDYYAQVIISDRLMDTLIFDASVAAYDTIDNALMIPVDQDNDSLNLYKITPQRAYRVYLKKEGYFPMDTVIEVGDLDTTQIIWNIPIESIIRVVWYAYGSHACVSVFSIDAF